MTNRITTATLFLALPAIAAAQSPLKADAIKIDPPARVADIDTDEVKGQPSRLAWSPDGKELYFQAMDGKFGQQEAKLRHYVLNAASGERKEVGAEPDWVSAYWTAKSWKAAPEGGLEIDLKSEQKVQKTVSTPMGGDLARGGGVGADGGSATTGDALAAAYNQQAVPVHTMRLHGEIVGEFVNSVIVPGLTFGWGPKGTKAIAYSKHKSGELIVMDEKGKRKEVDGTKDTLLPAWSPDGTRLAFLQKDGRKSFVLRVARVSGS